MHTYRELQLGLPERKPPGGDNFPADVHKARAWIGVLPRANLTVTSDMLEKALADLNQCRWPGKRRLAVLEVLRPVVMEVVAALHKQCENVAIPLALPKARVFERLQRLEAGLALGYRIAVVEMCAPSGKRPLLGRGKVATALARSAWHAARCLQHAYFIYRQPPAGTWAQLHRVHAFARSAGLVEQKVEDRLAGKRVRVGGTYAGALLMALSNPYRFSQREQQELADLSERLAPLLVLRDARSDPDQLAVSIGADRGPGYVAAEREEDDDARLWVDLAPLRERVEAAIAEAREGVARIALGERQVLAVAAELLARLRDGWERSQARSTRRLAAGHQLDTAIGISGLHFHLSGLVDFETFLRKAGESTGEQAGRAVWAHAAVDAGRVPLQRAEVIDQSLGGYQLRWAADQGVRARVGELIGLALATEEADRQWMLGVIRWLRYEDDGAVEAGIQLLSRRVRPVALRWVDGGGEAKPLRGVEYEPVSGSSEGALHLGAASMQATGPGQIEVLRLAETVDIDQPAPLRELAEVPAVAENAGDYVLLVAQRQERVA